MGSEFHCTVSVNLHPLIASQRLEIVEIELKHSIFQANDLSDLVTMSWLSIGRESHNFAFIAIFFVPDKLANHGVKTAQRVGKKHAIENFDFITLAPRHHGG